MTSLANAIRAAIQHGNSLADINVQRWATTFNCGAEDVRRVWELEMSIASQSPSNSYEVEGK